MITVKTPKGTASDLCLVQPDTRFLPEGTYKVRITLSAFDAADLLRICTEEAISAFGPKRAAKVSMPCGRNGADMTTFTFKSKSRPPLYDSRATLIAPAVVDSLRIADGSTIRVIGRAETYEGFGGGVVLLLHDVQIIHLVDSSGFEADMSGTFVVRDDQGLYRA